MTMEYPPSAVRSNRVRHLRQFAALTRTTHAVTVASLEVVMKIRNVLKPLAILGLASGGAHAHVGVQGVGFAGTNQEITFTIGHGCGDMDTFALKVEIPESVTGLRTISSTLGPAVVEFNEALLVSAVSWQKAESEILPGDQAYYKVTVRLRVPNAPFTQVAFPANQTCKSPTGETETALWTALTGDDGHDDGPGAAPMLTILPARVAGWNKYTVPVAVPDLSVFFADARIVWKGTSAYSNNPLTAEQITNTMGVTTLTSLAAGDEIWVQY